MPISCHFQIQLAISELQLTLPKVHTVHKVKSTERQSEDDISTDKCEGNESTDEGGM